MVRQSFLTSLILFRLSKEQAAAFARCGRCNRAPNIVADRKGGGTIPFLAAGRLSVTSRSDLTEAEENEIADQLENPATHFLILPGFGNDSADYTMPKSLVSSLSTRSEIHHPHIEPSQIHVLPLERIEWLQVFTKGIFDLKFWQANMPPTNPSFFWYLQKIYEEVNRIVKGQVEIGKKESDVKVVLLGHSAGGWLARAAVGYGIQTTAELAQKETNTAGPTNLLNNEKPQTPLEIQEQRLALEHIAGIVTLGAPHLPPPEGVMDMTRGALRITNEKFPGAFHHPDIFYITVAGNAVQGVQQERNSPFEPTSVSGFAFESYLQVCGNGNAMGDGVVPTDFAHLKDPKAIEIELDGVAHSITSPESWYGAEGIIDLWLETVITELRGHWGQRRDASLESASI